MEKYKKIYIHRTDGTRILVCRIDSYFIYFQEYDNRHCMWLDDIKIRLIEDMTNFVEQADE